MADVMGASDDTIDSLVILGQDDSRSPHFSQYFASYLASCGVVRVDGDGAGDGENDSIGVDRAALILDEALLLCDSGRDCLHDPGR